MVIFNCYSQKYNHPTYHKQTDEADLGDTTEGENATEDEGQAEKSPLADNSETTEL